MSRITTLVLGALLVTEMASATNILGVTGPDTFGYAGTPIAYNPRVLGDQTLGITLGDESMSGAITIPFGFNFYGTSYNEFYVSSNGFITFSFVPGQSNGCCSGPALPTLSSDPVALIAGLWNDLDPSSGGTVQYEITGAQGSREVVIDYSNVPDCCGSAVNPYSFQIILRELNNEIELQYLYAGRDASQASIGIMDETGTRGLQILLLTDQATVIQNEGYLITPAPEPSSAGLIGIGLVTLAIARRKIRKSRQAQAIA